MVPVVLLHTPAFDSQMKHSLRLNHLTQLSKGTSPYPSKASLSFTNKAIFYSLPDICHCKYHRHRGTGICEKKACSSSKRANHIRSTLTGGTANKGSYRRTVSCTKHERISTADHLARIVCIRR